MTGTSPVAAPTSLPLDCLLLDSEPSAPLPRRGMVSRDKMVDDAKSNARRVIAISVPTGSGGKSGRSRGAHDFGRRPCRT